MANQPTTCADDARPMARDVELAHALRTALTAIRGQAQLAQLRATRPDGLDRAGVLAALASIESATGELAATIDRFDLCAALRPPTAKATAAVPRPYLDGVLADLPASARQAAPS